MGSLSSEAQGSSAIISLSRFGSKAPRQVTEQDRSRIGSSRSSRAGGNLVLEPVARSGAEFRFWSNFWRAGGGAQVLEQVLHQFHKYSHMLFADTVMHIDTDISAC